MPRATSKAELLQNAQTQFQNLMQLIDSLSDKALATPFDFSADPKKKEAHWSRDRNVRDIYIHLYEWHMLLLSWVGANTNGKNQPFIPAPYNWKNYGDMNVMFWQKHQNTGCEQAKAWLMQSHQEVLQLAQSFSDEQLFQKNVYAWVGGSTLGSYFVSATASHYDWAIKKLKAHQKMCP